MAAENTPTRIDPVCGMRIEESRVAGSSEYEGTEYYFCSAGCKQKFDRDPTVYLGEPAAS